MSKTKIKKKISFINYNGVIFITFLSHFTHVGKSKSKVKINTVNFAINTMLIQC